MKSTSIVLLLAFQAARTNAKSCAWDDQTLQNCRAKSGLGPEDCTFSCIFEYSGMYHIDMYSLTVLKGSIGPSMSSQDSMIVQIAIHSTTIFAML